MPKVIVNDPLVGRPSCFQSFIRWLIPSLEAAELQKAIVNISAIMKHLENKTLGTVISLREVQILAKEVLQNRMTLDML